MPSTTPVEPEYPFQHLCVDFFHHEGVTYLVLVEWFSNCIPFQGWHIQSPADGIPDTLTLDGGTRAFLKIWGVHHRISSAYHPHTNCRAKVAVKTMKRLIAGNTGPGGTLSCPVRPTPQSPPAISERTRPHNEGIAGDMPLWKGHLLGIPDRYMPHPQDGPQGEG
jgi:hypothetical protein